MEICLYKAKVPSLSSVSFLHQKILLISRLEPLQVALQKEKEPHQRLLVQLAEEEGFEPPAPCSAIVFKTIAFDHSATPPDVNLVFLRYRIFALL
jgi:hypothetical protein